MLKCGFEVEHMNLLFYYLWKYVWGRFLKLRRSFMLNTAEDLQIPLWSIINTAIFSLSKFYLYKYFLENNFLLIATLSRCNLLPTHVDETWAKRLLLFILIYGYEWYGTSKILRIIFPSKQYMYYIQRISSI